MHKSVSEFIFQNKILQNQWENKIPTKYSISTEYILIMK